jgi:hypothetical protein
MSRLRVVLHGLGERRRVGEIADTYATPRDLVFVGGADAARGRADLALAAPRFAQQVQLAVVRQDEVRLVADEQAIADVDSRARELVDLCEERLRVDHDTVADHAGDAFVQNARRQQPQHELPAARVDGVPGVVSSLVSGDDGEVAGEEVDDLALAFIAPLGAEHCNVHVLALYLPIHNSSACLPCCSTATRST